MKTFLPQYLTLLTLSFSTLLTGQQAVAATTPPDLAQLLEGVHEIDGPGAPGNLCVFGDQAFPVVVGKVGHAGKTPVVGAASYGKGRVAAYSHDGCLSAPSLAVADSGPFIINLTRWAAGQRLAAGTKPQVGVYHNKNLVGFFEQHGFKTVEANLHQLNTIQVLVANAHNLSEPDVELITKFVQEGGGLITAATGWGWAMLNPAKDLRSDFVGNRLLIPMGMVWGDATVTHTGPKGFLTSDPPPASTHAGRALQLATDQIAGKSTLAPEDQENISASVTSAARALPANDKLFMPRLTQLATNSRVQVTPSPKTPIKKADLAARLTATFQSMTTKLLAPEQVQAHPASHIFPGDVPANAARISRKLEIDTHVPAWHSTGLYAAAGNVITVQLPDSAAHKGLGVRIGAHTDHLWNLEQWSRFPEISVNTKLEKPVTKLANAFGGLIYIEVPDKCDLGTVTVEIGGGIAAPYYVLGKTSLAEWKDRLSKEPAPWAELECSRVIVTLPSSVVRDLADPEALMKTWDQIVQIEDELAGTAADRRRPERIVTDQQISAGYMHSGYPIMTWMDQIKKFNDRDSLIKGNWGIFHELGHNHQSGDWTFEGTTEVTVNIFTLYVYDTLCKNREDNNKKFTPEAMRQTYLKYAGNGSPDFEKWKKDPFLALTMYAQLRDGFGWEAYKKVFAEYHALPASQRPKSDAEKHDQWMVRFSKTVNKNLGPFFQAWGVPVSKEALAQIASLPEWMPPQFPPKS